VLACAAVVIGLALTPHPANGGSAGPRYTLVLRSAAVVGRAVRVRAAVGGWSAGMTWRLYADGQYLGYSATRGLGLAAPLVPGRHTISADLWRGSTRVAVAKQRLRVTIAGNGGDPVIAAAGDIACDPDDPSFAKGRGTPTACQQAATARLIALARPSAVLPLGDTQYACGGSAAYARSYGPSWGRYLGISHPVPGNADYGEDEISTYKPTCSGAPGSGYFGYFGSRAGNPANGYYSFNVGSWHLVALNSECSHAGGCGVGSAQETWLRSDLASAAGQCTLLYWHRPRWTTDPSHDDLQIDPFWQDAVAAQADVVLNGHAHLYARFAQLGASGTPDPAGPREFIVGTGGHDVPGVTESRSTIQATRTRQFGILLLTLHANSYDWQFLPTGGGTYTDYGSTDCD
jgi:hypothetical protein